MKITRRGFVGGMVTFGALGLFAGKETTAKILKPTYKVVQASPTTIDEEAKVVHSVCLSCDARCGMRGVIKEGKLQSLYGNPYHPASTMVDPIRYDTKVIDSLDRSGTLCLKGVGGIQYLYNPYRIKTPLKRTGPRGSGKFKPISWEQLLNEVVEGGQLFSDIGEDKNIEGLRSLRSSEPIDPTSPELGAKSNQVVWNTGRGQTGRVEFIKRFLDAFGTKNYVSHTDICQMNFYVANYVFTGRYNEGVKGTSQLFADITHAKYILFFGVNIGGGWKPGVNTSAPLLANRKAINDVKFVLIDPYKQNGAAYANEHIPIKPGTDIALALAMIRWIIENKRYDQIYLENTNKKAAEKTNEPTWSNSTYLVITEEGHELNGQFLRAKHIGLGEDEFIVQSKDGRFKKFDEIDKGSLFTTTKVALADGTEVNAKTSLQIVKEEAFQKSIEEWSQICGVPSAVIERLASEFTSYGKEAGAGFYRGVAMHSYGFYAGWAIHILNSLIGNMNWRGGTINAMPVTEWTKGLYSLKEFEKPENKAVHISRIGPLSDIDYEETTEYKQKLKAGKPYPAKRPWFPFTQAGITTEALAAIETGYPYPVKCYFSYYINPIHSVPGGERFKETLANTEKLPLYIAIDTTISETSVYADYIVPDVTYLDGQYAMVSQQVGAIVSPHVGIRVPMVEPLTEKTEDGRSIMLETFLIDIAKKLNMPGFGDNAIPGMDLNNGKKFPLNRAEDYYLLAIANIAINADLPIASAEEIEFVEKNYWVSQFKEMFSEELWQKMCYCLARGGYFVPTDVVFDELGRNQQGFKVKEEAPLQLWHEKIATTRHSITGELYPGTIRFNSPEFFDGSKIYETDQDYPFHLVTFRLATKTKARSNYDYWANEIHPKNYIEINPLDAKELNIQEGDKVRMTSASNFVEGEARLTIRVSRGIIAATHHYGFTEQGTSPLEIAEANRVMLGGDVAFIDPILHGLNEPIAAGNKVIADKRRAAAGFNVNKAMRLEKETYDQTPLVDAYGGATIYQDTKVKIEKI